MNTENTQSRRGSRSRAPWRMPLLSLACGLMLLGALRQGIEAAQPGAVAAAVGEGASPQGNRRVFQVKGIIKRVSPAEQRVIVAHEEIPKYMAAMTMPFHVKNTNELSGLKAGDPVTFHYVVLPDDDWIEKIERLNIVSTAVTDTDRPVFLPLVEPLEPGDTLPSLAFTNHLGEPVRLGNSGGQPMILAFFYTRCPVKELCPRLTGELAGAASQMADGGNQAIRGQFLCITLDAAFDTPDVLRAYAEASGLTRANWQFLTSDSRTVSRLAALCGVVTLPEPGPLQHNIRVLVADGNRRVRKLFKGGAWTAAELAAELAALAATTFSTPPVK